jgi:hypothetical protein
MNSRSTTIVTVQCRGIPAVSGVAQEGSTHYVSRPASQTSDVASLPGPTSFMSAEVVLSLLPQAERQYSRIVLLVGPTGSGKTAILRAVGEALGRPVLNVGRELAERLLPFPPRFRPLEVARQLDELLAADGSTLVDNTEVLFDPVLEQEPLHLLQTLSRNRTVVLSWNGRVDDGQLTYGSPGHPAARRYRADGLLTVPLHT